MTDDLRRLFLLVDAAERMDAQVDILVEAAAQIQAEIRRVGTVAAELVTLTNEALLAAHPPVCPKCNGPMYLRTNRDSGEKFWGCAAYKGKRGQGCNGTQHYAQWRRQAREALATAAQRGITDPTVPDTRPAETLPEDRDAL